MSSHSGPAATVVIVGANLAGGQAAETLRTEGFDGRVVLIGEDPDRPYERPPLSKELLRGEADPDTAFLRPREWYAERAVELRLGVRATRLDPSGTVTLQDGEELSFDVCLLATGSRVRTLSVPGADLARVHYLRTLRDSVSVRDELGGANRVVVVGAGFIGAEVAASARVMGCEVTMLEIAPVPLGRVLGDELGAVYAQIHRDHGVDLRLNEGVDRFEGGSHGVEAVVGTSGTRYPCDLAVIGVGVLPADELARGAGIACSDGIDVDEHCRTSVARVLAAGDVANHPNPYAGKRIRVEHFQNADLQGRAAAQTILGRSEPYAEVPWFWSDQYDVNLQTLGHPDPDDEMIVRGSLPDRSVVAFWVRGDRVTGAVALNQGRQISVARRLIERGIRVDHAQLRDPGVELRDLLRRPARDTDGG